MAEALSGGGRRSRTLHFLLVYSSIPRINDLDLATSVALVDIWFDASISILAFSARATHQ